MEKPKEGCKNQQQKKDFCKIKYKPIPECNSQCYACKLVNKLCK